MKYDNTIDELILESNKYQHLWNKKPTFISDWMPAEQDIQPIRLINYDDKYINEYSYLYSIDDFGYKKYFNDFYKTFYKDEIPNFALFSNTTIALYLVFKKLMLSNTKNVLAFAPCYFTSDSALQSLNYNITFYNLIRTEDIDYDEICKIIKTNNIQVILITDPIYGTGVEIELNIYR